jgi:phospholipase/lecithinase/hemolysin
LEPLPRRDLLSGLAVVSSGAGPVATDDQYLTLEDSVVTRNMVIDDTGRGSDTSGPDGLPLIVTEIDGHSYRPAAPMTLASGATLSVSPNGDFTYDPTTSPVLGSIEAGTAAENDAFEYTVATGYSEIIVFGDSLSDVGNLYAISNETYPPDPPYWQGRVSNGPVWVEHLATRLALESTRENNYAVAGAMTGTGNFNEGRPGFDLPDDLPGLQDEIAQFTSSLTDLADSDALYIVWAGPNNFFVPPADPPAAITQAVGEIVTAVGTLRTAGAEHIVVANMPDLGITPDGLASGMGPLLTAFSEGFNGALQATLAAYSLEVIEFDAFGAFQDVVNDPGAFGFVNVTEPCFDGTGVCGNPDEYLFWDSVHPTTQGHQVLADLVFEQLVMQEPLANNDTATVKISVSDVATPVAFVDQHLYVGGTSGNDRIRMASGGDDSVYVYVNATRLGPFELPADARAVVFGHDGNDWLYAGSLRRSVILDGGSGNDSLYGGQGDDILRGDTGNDWLWGSSGDDTLYGNEGRDLLFGGLGDDLLIGGDGDDLLWGNAGADRLFGGTGNDWLFGDLNDEELDGGDGYDWIWGGRGRYRWWG